jgi:UDP-N-acetylmuramyl pentapeptide phosphotransferase/UDP-N-acetylglucosamine-1-phosphate transferase
MSPVGYLFIAIAVSVFIVLCVLLFGALGLSEHLRRRKEENKRLALETKKAIVSSIALNAQFKEQKQQLKPKPNRLHSRRGEVDWSLLSILAIAALLLAVIYFAQ